jgi:flagellar basal body-associated protein FliL
MVDGKSGAHAGREGERRPAVLDNRAFVLGLIVIVQTILAIALTHFVIVPRLNAGAAGANAGSAAVTASGLPASGVIVPLNEIIVTLDTDAYRPRYLRINVNLEVVDDDVAVTVAERLPELRDAVIMALSTRTVADLGDAAGKKRLRDEIFRDVAARLPAGTLLNVYFSDLVVQ